MTACARHGSAADGDRSVHGFSKRRLGLPVLCLALAGIAVGAGSGCAAFDADDAVTHLRPETVDHYTVCEEWMRLPAADRTSYAIHRLAELRSEDGVDPALDPPTGSQASTLRTYMERQCGMETMHVAAIWRVAHDQYTQLYDRRVLLD